MTKLFNGVIGKTGKVYAALLGKLAVQGTEVNVLGHSEMCAADILLQSVCWLIYRDLSHFYWPNNALNCIKLKC